MNLNPWFNLRFKTVIGGADFIAEVECDNLAEVGEKCQKIYSAQEGIELIAAYIVFSLVKPGGSGCYPLDDHSNVLLNTIVKALGVGNEHFMNERLGKFDMFKNTVEPADMGNVFPDGTIRFVWWEDKSSLGFFDETFELLNNALAMLIRMEEMPYFRETEQEFEECDGTGVMTRRTEALFKAGLFPAEDNTFEAEPGQTIDTVLQFYATQAVPESTPA